MFYVYVLKSKKDNKHYIGFTPDLKNRYEEHQSGKVRSTFYRRPFELIYYECYKNRKTATEREKEIKSGRAHVALMKRLNSD
jgi:putative endonuclease